MAWHWSELIVGVVSAVLGWLTRHYSPPGGEG